MDKLCMKKDAWPKMSKMLSNSKVIPPSNYIYCKHALKNICITVQMKEIQKNDDYKCYF